MAGDLNLDLDGIDRFACQIVNMRGQWDGTASEVGDDRYLCGSKDLVGALADFNAKWAQAATLIDTYITHLAQMANACVAQFRQVDHALAQEPTHVRGHHLQTF